MCPNDLINLIKDYVNNYTWKCDWLQKTIPLGLSMLRLIEELSLGRKDVQKALLYAGAFLLLVRGMCHFLMSFIAQVQNLTAITFELYLHESYITTSMKDDLVWDSFGRISKIYSNYMSFSKNKG